MFGNPKHTKLEAAQPDAQFGITVPAEMTQGMTFGGSVAPRISRREALQVPAVLRARNLIAGTLGGLPIRVRDPERNVVDGTNYIVAEGYQIDPDVANVVTLAFTYEDLLFEGVAWWRVLDRGFHRYPTFAEHIGTDRVHVTGWTPPVNGLGPQPGNVYIDGYPVADNAVIRFDSPNPPLLVHAARAIRTCLTLDTTAAGYADTPMPLGVFRPKDGTRPNENPEFVDAMLDKWEEGRRRRKWGYVGAAWEIEKMQFDAEQIQLADQRQHAVLEIARAQRGLTLRTSV